MTDIVNNNVEVNTVQSASVSTLYLKNGNYNHLELPSPLANAVINLNYTLDGAPVYEDVEGRLTLLGQYKDGPLVTIVELDLINQYSYTIAGKYTKIYAELQDLSGADTVIVFADQNANIIPSAVDEGAIALVVNSEDDTIIQNSPSSYDAITRTITVNLSADGDGGITEIESDDSLTISSPTPTTRKIINNLNVKFVTAPYTMLGTDSTIFVTNTGTITMMDPGDVIEGRIYTIVANAGGILVNGTGILTKFINAPQGVLSFIYDNVNSRFQNVGYPELGVPYGPAQLNSAGFLNQTFLASGIDATKLASGLTLNSDIDNLAGTTGNIQTQINNLTTGYNSFSCVAVATANKDIASPGASDWDGITPANGDVVFLLPVASGGSQTTASQGGLYIYNGASSPLTRIVGMDTWAEITGSRIYVDVGGPTFQNTIWLNTNNNNGTIDVTAVTYMQSYNNYIAGTNLQLVGNVFSAPGEVYDSGGNTPGSLASRDEFGELRANNANSSDIASTIGVTPDTTGTVAYPLFANNVGPSFQGARTNPDFNYNPTTNTLTVNVAGYATTSDLTSGLATKEPTITTLPISKGGTGVNTLGAGRVLITDATGALTPLISPGNNAYCLTSVGPGAPPEFTPPKIKAEIENSRSNNFLSTSTEIIVAMGANTNILEGSYQLIIQDPANIDNRLVILYELIMNRTNIAASPKYLIKKVSDSAGIINKYNVGSYFTFTLYLRQSPVPLYLALTVQMTGGLIFGTSTLRFTCVAYATSYNTNDMTITPYIAGPFSTLSALYPATSSAVVTDEVMATTEYADTVALGRAPSTLTDTDPLTMNLTLQNFKVTLGGNRTLGVPTNIAAGRSGSISIRQDSTGSRTLAYAWCYEFSGGAVPVLSTGKFVFDQLYYYVNYYSTSTVTMTIATPGVVTWTAHGLVSGQKIQLTTTGALPTGLTANTTYWVNVTGANTFNLSSSLANLQAGTYIATSGTQSGTHTAVAMSITISANLGVS